MRFLINRTDAIGDLVVSLSLVERILSRDPLAEIHLLVRDTTAPLLEGHPGINAVHLRGKDSDLEPLLKLVRPDAVLNLSHRDRALAVAAKRTGVPIRVSRARGLDQIRSATHLLWKGRYGTGRHESQNILDFLAPFGWEGGWPPPPRLYLSEAERALGEADLARILRPRVGIVRKGSGAGAHPSDGWWDRMESVLRGAGWNPIVLAPPSASTLPETNLRGLMSRLTACNVVISPSTGPAHLSAALGVPLLVLMGRRRNHGPDRWTPLGDRIQVVQYPGLEADLEDGMDRLPHESLLPHLDRLR